MSEPEIAKNSQNPYFGVQCCSTSCTFVPPLGLSLAILAQFTLKMCVAA